MTHRYETFSVLKIIEKLMGRFKNKLARNREEKRVEGCKNR
ncbi:MAG: hypothetical protein QXU11_04755 [Thermoproteota archaeon]